MQPDPDEDHNRNRNIIASPRNPRLRTLAQWIKSPRHRRRNRVVVLEGEHLVRAWLDAGRPLRELWVIEECRTVPAVMALLRRIHAEADLGLKVGAGSDSSSDSSSGSMTCALTCAGCSIHHVSVALLGPITTLPSPPSVIAVAAAVEERLPGRIGDDVLVLDRVQDPANVGAIIRTAAAAGLRRIVTTPGTAECWSPKALRAGMGGQFRLAIHESIAWPTLRAALDVPVTGLVAHGGRALHHADLRAPRAWLFGNEGQGIDADVDADLDERLTIDQTQGVESLNVAAAFAVCAFEQRRQRSTA